jgi:hypothetical protein
LEGREMQKEKGSERGKREKEKGNERRGKAESYY